MNDHLHASLTKISEMVKAIVLRFGKREKISGLVYEEAFMGVLALLTVLIIIQTGWDSIKS